MFRIYHISLVQDSKNFIQANAGYAFYGALFKGINPEHGVFLHNQNTTTISQHIEVQENGNIIWKVSLFGSETIEIVAPVLESISQISLYGQRVNLTVSYKDYMEYDTPQSYFNSNVKDDKPNLWKMEFLTPTTFKSNGEYVLYPTVDLILKNLMKKYCAFFGDVQTNEILILEKMLPHIKIIAYNLKSTDYPIKTVKIPSFIGELALQSSLKREKLQLLNELLCFANIAGVGIKTALGMGGTSCVKK